MKLSSDTSGRLSRFNNLFVALTLICTGVTGGAYLRSNTVSAASQNGVIVFASQRDVASPVASSPSEIYVIDEDGTGLTNLTNNASDDFLPAWSPDGTKLAWTSNRDGDYEIYTAEYDAQSRSLSSPLQLTFNSRSDRFPAWSPDGNTMVFMSQRDANGNFEIYKIDLTSTDRPAADLNAERLTFTSGVEDCCPSVSPDGTQFVYASLASGDFELYTMSLSDPTHTPVNITNRPSPSVTPFHGYDGTPTWSSDGKILYRSLRADNTYSSDIYEIDPATGISTQLTSKANAKQPQASPDSTKIVYSGGLENQEDIWILNRATNTRTVLSAAPGRDGDADWQPVPQVNPEEEPMPSGADLIVENVTLSPAQPQAGEQVSFVATIKNSGDSPTPSGQHHGMIISIGTFNVWASWNTASLAPGATRQLAGSMGTNGVTQWTGQSGTHVLKAEVDKQGIIPEANETNNVYMKTIVIESSSLSRASTSTLTPVSGPVSNNSSGKK